MKKIDFGQKLEILANVGVIAGIVFLALELRQNNQQLALQSYQDWVATNMQINTAIMDPEIAAIANAGNIDATNLTDDTFITHAMIQLAMFQMAQATDYLYRQGALDEGLWRAEMSRAAGILSIPSVRQWWDAGGRTQVAESFANFIESVETDIAIWGWDPEAGYIQDDALERSRRRYGVE